MTLGLLEGFKSCFLCELRVHLLVISTLIPYFSLFIVIYGFALSSFMDPNAAEKISKKLEIATHKNLALPK